MNGKDEKARSLIQGIKGMQDLLPGQTEQFQFLEDTARRLFASYGYSEVRTPLLEPTELFSRSVGEASDVVVSKQMYTFMDPGERSNTIRPEGTAGVVRALVGNGYLKREASARFYYMGPMFRYERPQKGRLRQFTQIGMECFGVSHAAADAEIIGFSQAFLSAIGFENLEIRLNTIGCRECRKSYNAKLRSAIVAIGKGGIPWCEQCLQRCELNPMRVFDCKVETCRVLIEKLPSISGEVCNDCERHHKQLQAILSAMRVPFVDDPGLVRGFDYYSRTVFEIVQTNIGSQSAIVGGGRYDYLVEELGGPSTPAVGMSVGVERVLLSMEAQGIQFPAQETPAYFVIAMDEHCIPAACEWVNRVRKAGVKVAFDSQPRSLKSGLKAADRQKARFAIIIGSSEVERGVVIKKDLSTGEQAEIPLELESYPGSPV